MHILCLGLFVLWIVSSVEWWYYASNYKRLRRYLHTLWKDTPHAPVKQEIERVLRDEEV